MAITKANLIAYNGIESTDILFGATQTPYYRQPTYVPGVSCVNGFEEYVAGGQSGRGSIVLIRELGRGNVVTVKANVDGAFDYTHVQTADNVTAVPLDDVIKQSEKIYEAVDVARHSATGAKKADIVVNNVLQRAQELASGYLLAGANKSAVGAIADGAALKAALIKEFVELDITPDILSVTKKTLGLLLTLVTGGDFIPNPREEAFRTGVVGKILGMDVVVDEALDDTKVAYIMYNHQYFGVFTVFKALSIVPAVDFDGSYARALVQQGGYAKVRAKGQGSWAIAHLIAALT